MSIGHSKSARTPRPERPVLRACLAVLAIVANMTLPAAWSGAAPLADGFGNIYSICLASGGTIEKAPYNPLPDSPAAAALHCGLCLFSGIFEVPTGSTGEIEILFFRPGAGYFGYAEPALSPRFLAQIFDSRAPPA